MRKVLILKQINAFFNKFKTKILKFSLYFHFLILNFIILLFIFLSLFLFFNYYFKNQYINFFKNEINVIKQTINVSLRPLLLTEDYDRIERLLVGLVSETQIESIKLANTEGKVLLKISSIDNKIDVNYLPDEVISKASDIDIEDDESIYIIFPITDLISHEKLAYLEIKYSKKFLKIIINDTLRILVLITLFGAIIVLFMLTLIFKYVNKDFKILTSYLIDIPHKKGKKLNYEFFSKELQEFKDVLENISQILRDQERELTKERLKIEKILSALNEVVVFTDYDLNIIYTNTAFMRLFNINEDMLQNNKINLLINLLNSDKKTSFWTSFELYRKLIADNLVHSELSFEELYYQTPENVFKILELTVIPLKEEELEGILFIMRDVTHRKILDEELRKLQKFEAIDRLAGGVAHDLRNLLAGLYNYLHILRLHLKERADEPLLERIEKILERANSLSSQLLSLSKGGVPLKRAGNLEELIKEVGEFCFSGSPVSFELRVKSKVDRVLFDPQQMAMVFQNLFINAREAMPEGGRVTVEIDVRELREEEVPPLPAGTYVVITVSDTGPGIPQDILPYIFDPFFTTKEKGSGLGLTVVFQIMKNHGGYVTVDSEPGRGTTFYLYLPYERGKIEEVPAKRETQVSEVTGKRILIVDDEEDIRETLRYILHELGFEAYSVGTGEEALRIFREGMSEGKPFGIVIIDYTMPDMSGDRLLEKLREIYPQFLAILSTGYADIPVVTDYSKFGFDRVLLKPYTVDQLLSIISGKESSY